MQARPIDDINCFGKPIYLDVKAIDQKDEASTLCNRFAKIDQYELTMHVMPEIRQINEGDRKHHDLTFTHRFIPLLQQLSSPMISDILFENQNIATMSEANSEFSPDEVIFGLICSIFQFNQCFHRYINDSKGHNFRINWDSSNVNWRSGIGNFRQRPSESSQSKVFNNKN